MCIGHEAKKKRCPNEGCTNNVIKGGVCIKHGAKGEHNDSASIDGGILGAASILDYGGNLQLALAFLSEFAHDLLEENPKMGRVAAYLMAIKNYISEPVAN